MFLAFLNNETLFPQYFKIFRLWQQDKILYLRLHRQPALGFYH
jgi:hypothetical protein